MRMPTPALAFLVVAPCGFLDDPPARPAPSAAGMSLESHFAFDPNGLIARFGQALATVRVIDMPDPKARSNGNPPRVRLQVLEVLRGKVDEEWLTATWAPPPHDIDYAGGNAKEHLAAWGEQPLNPPSIGSDWVVVLTKWREEFAVASSFRMPRTDELLTQVRQSLVDTARIEAAASSEKALSDDQRRAADRALDKITEAAPLWRTFTDVVIARHASSSIGLGDQIIGLHVVRVLRSAPGGQDFASKPIAYVRASRLAGRMQWLRAGQPGDEVVVFLRRVAPPPPEDARPCVRYQLFDPLSGYLRADPERFAELERLAKESLDRPATATDPAPPPPR